MKVKEFGEHKMLTILENPVRKNLCMWSRVLLANPEDIQCMEQGYWERKQGLPSVFLPSKKSEVEEHSCFPGFQANTQVTTEKKLPFPFKSLNTASNKSHGPTSLRKELQFSITLKAKAATRTTYRIQSQYITNMSR